MKTKVISCLLIAIVLAGALGIALLPQTASGQAGSIIQNIRQQSETFNQQNVGLPSNSSDPIQLIGRIITYLLGFLGIVFLLIVLWGGLQWMLSGGDEKKVASARKRIVSAAVGIAVIVLSLAIVQFILLILEKAV